MAEKSHFETSEGVPPKKTPVSRKICNYGNHGTVTFHVLVVFITCTVSELSPALACLEIRSRNEEAINSSRNITYSLKVFHFPFYRCRYFLFVSELI